MAEHIELGKAGEDYAAAYLVSKGYKILERNWRFGQMEIDIIAQNKLELVVVEVKTRTSKEFSNIHIPDLINRAKERFLVNAASAYLNRYCINKECRFDLICVLKEGELKINHIEGAFYPRA